MQTWLSLPCSYRAYQKGLQVFYPSAWKKVCSLRGKATINISKAFWARQYRLTVYHLPSTAGQVGRAKKPHFPFALLLLIDRTFGDSLHSTQSTSIYGKKDSSCSCGGAGRAAIRNRLFLNTEEILGKILGILSRSIKSETSNVPIFICLLESTWHIPGDLDISTVNTADDTACNKYHITALLYLITTKAQAIDAAHLYSCDQSLPNTKSYRTLSFAFSSQHVNVRLEQSKSSSFSPFAD